MSARLVNVTLGLWLFLSSFLLTHSHAARLNGWIVGIVATTAGLAGASGIKAGRYVNVLLGAWLMLSAVFINRWGPGFWNHVAVGFGLVLFAVAHDLRSLRRRQRADI